MATFIGTSANDTLSGGAAADVLYGYDGHDDLRGFGGEDLIRGYAGMDLLAGGAGNDTLDGGADEDIAFYTGNFADYTITYNSATREYTLVDSVGGRDGTDVVKNVENFGFADGPKSWGEVVPGMGDGVAVLGTAASETLQGGSGYDVLYGYEGNDDLRGFGGGDQLRGYGGMDVLHGGAGNDNLDGGAGDDIAFYMGNFADYTITYNSATREYTLVDSTAGRDGTDVVKNVETFGFADGPKSWGEVVPGTGDGVALLGTAFQDTLQGGSGYDILYGYEGHDDLRGNGGGDQLKGYGGADLLNGGAGNDTLDGGADGDLAFYMGNFADYTITYDSVTRQYTLVDSVAGRDGTDVVKNVETFGFADGPKSWGEVVPGMGDGAAVLGTAGSDTLEGGSGYDILYGYEGHDDLRGFGGGDQLKGYGGMDFMHGGAGNDTLDGGTDIDFSNYTGNFAEYTISYDSLTRQYTVVDTAAGRDGTDLVKNVENFGFADGHKTWAEVVPGQGDGLLLNGTPAGDYLMGGTGLDTVNGLGGGDILIGLDANDRLDGAGGDDRLFGGNGDDTMIGGAGNDEFDMGAGSDTVQGGAGADLYKFTSPGEPVDTILDFNAADDMVGLNTIYFTGLNVGTLDPDSFRSGAAVQALDANDLILFDTASGALYYDADGSGAAAAIQLAVLSLSGLTGTLTANNFAVLF